MWERRIAAAIIDFILSIIPLFIICNIILGNVAGEDIDLQVSPIIAFLMVLSPIGIVQHLIEYPYSLGINIWQLGLSIFIAFAIEVVMYSLFELSPMRRTIGKALMRIEYERTLTLRCVLVRNTIKTLTRYVYGIPLLFILFSKKRQTLHDVISNNAVINSTGK